MNDFVKVTASRPHSNEYGNYYLKSTGESYFVPRDVAESLLAGGWINAFEGSADGNAGEVRGRKGTGTGTSAAGQGSDTKIDSAAGA